MLIYALWNVLNMSLIPKWLNGFYYLKTLFDIYLHVIFIYVFIYLWTMKNKCQISYFYADFYYYVIFIYLSYGASFQLPISVLQLN